MTTMGYTTIGSSALAASSPFIRLNKYTAPQTGTLAKMTVYIHGAGTSTEKITCIIYTDSAGVPNVPLTNGTTNEVTVGASFGPAFQDFTFSTPPSVTSGTPYWLGWMTGTTSSGFNMYEDNVGATMQFQSITYPTAPNPFSSGGTVSQQYTVYATFVATSPVNTVAPAVTGTATVGSVLTTTNGTWTDAGSPAFTYQWQRDTAGNLSFSDIGSATSSTYTLVDADDGNKVRCNVKDTDANGNTTAASNATSLVAEAGVPANTVAPAVTGSTTVGSTLTTDNGTWTGLGGITHTYTYKWQRDAQGSGGYSDIASATATTYVLVTADNACHVRSVVTATNDVGAGSPANSNAVLDTTSSGSGGTAGQGLMTSLGVG